MLKWLSFEESQIVFEQHTDSILGSYYLTKLLEIVNSDVSNNLLLLGILSECICLYHSSVVFWDSFKPS